MNYLQDFWTVVQSLWFVLVPVIGIFVVALTIEWWLRRQT